METTVIIRIVHRKLYLSQLTKKILKITRRDACVLSRHDHHHRRVEPFFVLFCSRPYFAFCEQDLLGTTRTNVELSRCSQNTDNILPELRQSFSFALLLLACVLFMGVLYAVRIFSQTLTFSDFFWQNFFPKLHMAFARIDISESNTSQRIV